MGLVERVRRLVNESANRFGNKLVPGFGDFLTRDVSSLKRELMMAAATPLLAASMIFSNGCFEGGGGTSTVFDGGGSGGGNGGGGGSGGGGSGGGSGGSSGGGSGQQGNYKLFVQNPPAPVKGAKVTVWPAALYNVEDGTGIEPVADPNTPYVTGDDGTVLLNLDGPSHIVVSKEGYPDVVQFNVKPLQTTSANQPRCLEYLLTSSDSDIDFCRPVGLRRPIGEECQGVNFQGHIKHDGEVVGNQYVKGEFVSIILRGEVSNNSPLPETSASFLVMYTGTTPDPNTEELVYQGLGDPSKTLNIVRGEKKAKNFLYQIPLDAREGWYRIYVSNGCYANSKGHLIGVFRVIRDTTPPQLIVDPFKEAFSNEAFVMSCSVYDPPQEGTVRAAGFSIQVVSDATVIVDKDARDGILSSDVVSSSSICEIPAYGEDLEGVTNNDINKIGRNAQIYTLTFRSTDLSGNTVTKQAQAKIYLTKAEADALADIIYDEFNIGPNSTITFPDDYKRDIILPYSRGPPHNFFVNRFNYGTLGGTGHTYNNQSLTEADKITLESHISYAPRDGDTVKPIPRSTVQEFINTLRAYLQFLHDNGKF